MTDSTVTIPLPEEDIPNSAAYYVYGDPAEYAPEGQLDLFVALHNAGLPTDEDDTVLDQASKMLLWHLPREDRMTVEHALVSAGQSPYEKTNAEVVEFIKANDLKLTVADEVIGEFLDLHARLVALPEEQQEALNTALYRYREEAQAVPEKRWSLAQVRDAGVLASQRTYAGVQVQDEVTTHYERLAYDSTTDFWARPAHNAQQWTYDPLFNRFVIEAWRWRPRTEFTEWTERKSGPYFQIQDSSWIHGNPARATQTFYSPDGVSWIHEAQVLKGTTYTD
ncbi:hypothetical protein ACFU9B_39115 [Streptomyces sp. NPDC057592]|uniref:hypothetical protein n=1 Tax=unclassified Streptomyces TaxID=2593676 RepID=UPI0036B5CE51